MSRKPLAPPDMEGGPEAPRFAWARRTTAKLTEIVIDVARPRPDGYVDVGDIPGLADALADELKVMPMLVREVLSAWLTQQGLPMTALVRDICTYLPCVTKLLKDGRSAPPLRLVDNQDTDLGYYPVRFIDMRATTNGGAEYLAEVVWGRMLGRRGYMKADLAGVKQAMIVHKLGFTKRYLKRTAYRRLAPRDVVGMHIWASISFAPTWKTFWGLQEVVLSVRPARNDVKFMAENRKLMRLRQTPCPKGLKLPCCGCRLGISDCERAVRLAAKPEPTAVECPEKEPECQVTIPT